MVLNVADYVGSDATRGYSPVHGGFVGSVPQSLLHVAPVRYSQSRRSSHPSTLKVRRTGQPWRIDA
jgi:hypothetical protein